MSMPKWGRRGSPFRMRCEPYTPLMAALDGPSEAVEEVGTGVVGPAGHLDELDFRRDASQIFFAARRHLALGQPVDPFYLILARLHREDLPLAPAIRPSQFEHRFPGGVPTEADQEPTVLRNAHRGAIELHRGSRCHAPAEQGSLRARAVEAKAGVGRP